MGESFKRLISRTESNYQRKNWNVKMSLPWILLVILPFHLAITSCQSSDVLHNMDDFWNASGKVRNLILEPGSDNVTGTWEPPIASMGNLKNYTVKIQRIALLGCENLGRKSPDEDEIRRTVSESTVSVGGLHPYARYNFTVNANTTELGPVLWQVFETHQRETPTSKVSNFRFKNKYTLSWDHPKDCTEITGSTKVTLLRFWGISERSKNSFVEKQTAYHKINLARVKGLIPDAFYKVCAYVKRDFESPPINRTYREERQKIPSSPAGVRNLDVYEVGGSTNTISVRWELPDPVNGTITSYQMSLMHENSVIENRSIEVSDLKRCMPSHVCFENLTLPSDITLDVDLKLQVFPKYTNVTENRSVIPYPFTLRKLIVKAPGRPKNVTVIPGRHGVVTLKWMDPLFTPTKIVRYQIHVKFLRTNLLINPPTENQDIDYNITKKEEVHSMELHLLTSTNYSVCMEAVNYHNRTSVEVTKLIHVPNNVTFTSKHKLHVELNGMLIKLKVPVAANSTRNTTVVVIVKGVSMCAEKSPNNLSPFLNETKFTKEWIAAEYLVNSSESVELIFNISQSYGVEKHCFFQLSETYEFKIAVTDWYSMTRDYLKSDPITFDNKEPFQKLETIIWLLSILILIICSLFVLIRYRKHIKAGMKSGNARHFPFARITNRSYGYHTNKRTTPSPEATNDQVFTQNVEPDVKLCDLHFEPVKIEELEEYIRKAVTNLLIESQWKMLPRGLQKPCKCGYLPENRLKNQCIQAIPYDSNRVILDKNLNESYYDYINASYIEGYQKVKAYIATQGPKRDESTDTDTVVDFWRMIWQEDVRVICMLTNVVEDGKKKCEQYWPEVGKNVEYGDNFVLNLDHEVFTDYTIRTLQLMCRGGRREIKHFHYTAWPEHGVPMFTQSLASFMKKLLATPVGKGPMVVHGSLGVGRTGTLILCDICLRQAVKERVINIPAVTLRIREERTDMVGTMQQYLLAYLVVAECKILERTQILCTDTFEQKLEESRKRLPLEVERLEKIVWQDRALHSLAERPSSINDNETSYGLDQRSQSDLQRADFGALPSPHSDRHRFDAISVEGFQKKGQYFATRLPSLSSLPDFWCLVAKKKIELIVVIQDSDPEDTTSCTIMPDQPTFSYLSHVGSKVNSTVEDDKYFRTDTLRLADTSQNDVEEQPVTILTCTGWAGQGNVEPPPAEALVSLWMASEKVQRKDSPTLVICRDGVTGCGLYLALSFLLDRMSLERQFDVIAAVRAIRRSNLNFVQSLEQFEYLYDAALNFNTHFTTYANFS